MIACGQQLQEGAAGHRDEGFLAAFLVGVLGGGMSLCVSVHAGTSGLGLLFTFPFQSTLLSPSLSDKSWRKSLLCFFGVAVDSNPFVPSMARITGSKYSRGAILGVPAWS